MSFFGLEHIKRQISQLLVLSVRKRAILFRLFFCWAIGCLALVADENRSYDRRFNIRGDQNADPQIVLVDLSANDFVRPFDVRTKSFAQLNEITDFTDSLFWDQKIWFYLLRTILQENPQAVGVTLWFGDNIHTPVLTPFEVNVFQDPRVIWSTSMNNLEQLLIPRFSNIDGTNIGSHDLSIDEDGIIRRINTNEFISIDHVVDRMLNLERARTIRESSEKSFMINYRGHPSKVFERVKLTEVLDGTHKPDLFKDKFVLIGTETSGTSATYLTPLGPMSRHEVIGQILDNQKNNRWIQRFSFLTNAFLLLLLTVFGAFIVIAYPQPVAFVFYLWTGTVCAALSAWVFDTFSIWIPAMTPIVLLITIWITFVGYRAMLAEKKHAKLQEEQLYLQELEQLKNNFVSLISHDLKTPIAKIQAITHKIRQSNLDSNLKSDLDSLHSSSEELNRYIQSILKVLRVESRDFKLHIETEDINEVVESAATQLRPLAQNKNITIKTELEPLFAIEFDVTLIKEVVINLIENAIKYTAAGGSILIQTTETAEEKIRVTIRDTGQGISAEDLNLVWQKFVRGKNEEHRTKGTGLGLYLVKYFIELHGGNVHIESTLGKGTTVLFELPIDRITSEATHGTA